MIVDAYGSATIQTDAEVFSQVYGLPDLTPDNLPGWCWSSDLTMAVTVIALERRQLDIADLSAVRDYVLSSVPDWVVNAAAFTDVERAEVATDEARSVNSHGARNLAIAAGQVNARLIHISSDFVFDGSARAGRSLGDRAHLMALFGMGRQFHDKNVRPHAEARVRASCRGSGGSPHRSEVSRQGHLGDRRYARLGILRGDIRVSPIETWEHATSVRRPAYSVLNTASLRKHGIEAVHWRDQLRTVLEEVKNDQTSGRRAIMHVMDL